MTSRATPSAEIRIRRTKLLSLLLPLALLGCWRPDPPGIRFAELVAGDAIVVEVRSKGCFHDSRTTFRLFVDDTGTPRMRASLRDAPVLWWGGERFEGAVSRADLTALDSLFDYYRSQSQDVECTTDEKITVERRRGRRVRERERFVDSTCPGWFGSKVRAIDEILGEAMFGAPPESEVGVG